MGDHDRSNEDAGDQSDYVTRLSWINLLTEPAIRSAIQALQLPPGSRGLDAACGVGNNTLWMAEAVSPAGHVTGMDISPDHLAHARVAASKSQLAGQVSFQEGDLNELPFNDNTFDWAWCKDSLWPGPKEMGCAAEEPLPLVNELARVVKPGGIVAIVFWSSHRLLPGYPLLEARLNATVTPNLPCTEGTKPELHFMRALAWLREARLEEPTIHTFVADVQAPLSDDIRYALTLTFQMLWGTAESEVTPEDWEVFQQLCRPGSPDSILNLPDYYALVTYSLFYGRVAEPF